jgi:NAD(P)-dependent dehydrogenase (short-subunit alcohol dehydrogenase family)
MLVPRTALVTGAARRIGRHLALSLAREGFDVAIHCKSSVVDAEAVADDIRAMGRRVLILAADLANPGEVDALVPAAVAALGPLGVLVNNSSTFTGDELPEVTRESYVRHLTVNLETPIFLSQAFARQLPESAEGLILHLIDQRVWKPTPIFFSYSLSKAALWEATRTMAQALAPRIRVVGLAPGPTLRNIRQSEGDFAKQASATLLERGPALEEFSAALRFVLAARSLTGQMIALDGGQHLVWQTSDVVGIVE